LLDAATGNLLWVKRDIGPQQRVTLAFSPDGKTLCAGSLGGPAVLLDAGTGQTRRTLAAKGVEAAAFSPDGGRVAAACRDATGGEVRAEVRLWDARTGKLLRTIPQGRRTVAFSPDGKRLATGGEGDAVLVWDAGTGEVERSVKGKPASLVAFSPDGKTLACVEGAAGPLSLWDTASSERLRKLDDGPVATAAFSPDGKYLVAWKGKRGSSRWKTAEVLGGESGK
jgi:WD40 repeat protein